MLSFYFQKLLEVGHFLLLLRIFLGGFLCLSAWRLAFRRDFGHRQALGRLLACLKSLLGMSGFDSARHSLPQFGLLKP